MTVHLADGNVLIAMTVTDHVHHRETRSWFDTETPQLATCPTTQGTFVRFLLREGIPSQAAIGALERIVAQSWHVFWPDEIGYDSTVLAGVIGHRQVTDAYLVALANHFGGRIVSLDRGLAARYGEAVALIET